LRAVNTIVEFILLFEQMGT